MRNYQLKFTLKSDATFGRGDGIAGLIDMEVKHDAYGCPYLAGRTLRGLLVEECANLLFAARSHRSEFEPLATRLFGRPGSKISDQAILHVGDAKLPADLREAIRIGIARKEIFPADVLDALTWIRTQTAVDIIKESPKKDTLRTMRVILRQTTFIASLYFSTEPTDLELGLLAACVKAFRRLGQGRNRGLGELEQVQLLDPAGQVLTDRLFRVFRERLEVVS
jgi:CRISPR/Cas system CSM-associated protein Csm3 (group 7 of RAMP superfamily)